MRVPQFDTELKNFIPPVQAALSLSPGALERSTVTDVFPSFFGEGETHEIIDAECSGALQ